MPKKPNVEPFYLIIKDDDKNVFTVVGPMTDDTQWIEKVVHAQQKGREVRCETAGKGLARSEVVAEIRQGTRLRYVDESFV